MGSVAVRRLLFVLVLAVLAGPALAEGPAYSLKTVPDSEPPKEVAEAVARLLGGRSVQLLDDKGETVLELWFRKSLPVSATEAQVSNGLTYAEVPPSTLFGVVRVSREMLDYRKQKVTEGAYTLRWASQPPDGDHAGTAPTTDFLLLCPAGD